MVLQFPLPTVFNKVCLAPRIQPLLLAQSSLTTYNYSRIRTLVQLWGHSLRILICELNLQGSSEPFLAASTTISQPKCDQLTYTQYSKCQQSQLPSYSPERWHCYKISILSAGFSMAMSVCGAPEIPTIGTLRLGNPRNADANSLPGPAGPGK